MEDNSDVHPYSPSHAYWDTAVVQRRITRALYVILGLMVFVAVLLLSATNVWGIGTFIATVFGFPFELLAKLAPEKTALLVGIASSAISVAAMLSLALSVLPQYAKAAKYSINASWVAVGLHTVSLGYILYLCFNGPGAVLGILPAFLGIYVATLVLDLTDKPMVRKHYFVWSLVVLTFSLLFSLHYLVTAQDTRYVLLVGLSIGTLVARVYMTKILLRLPPDHPASIYLTKCRLTFEPAK